LSSDLLYDVINNSEDYNKYAMKYGKKISINYVKIPEFPDMSVDEYENAKIIFFYNRQKNVTFMHRYQVAKYVIFD
jgi:hypothetical protein